MLATDALCEVILAAQAQSAASHPRVLDTRSMYAATLFLGGDFRQALAAVDELAVLYTRAVGARDTRVLDCRRQAAYCHTELGDIKAALAAFQALLDNVRRDGDDRNPDALELRHQIGILLLAANRLREAAQVLRPLQQDLVVARGPDDPDTQEVRDVLTRIQLTGGTWRGQRRPFYRRHQVSLPHAGMPLPGVRQARCQARLQAARQAAAEGSSAPVRYRRMRPTRIRQRTHPRESARVVHHRRATRISRARSLRASSATSVAPSTGPSGGCAATTSMSRSSGFHPAEPNRVTRPTRSVPSPNVCLSILIQRNYPVDDSRQLTTFTINRPRSMTAMAGPEFWLTDDARSGDAVGNMESCRTIETESRRGSRRSAGSRR
jgi:hypothetical protein